AQLQEQVAALDAQGRLVTALEARRQALARELEDLRASLTKAAARRAELEKAAAQRPQVEQDLAALAEARARVADFNARRSEHGQRVAAVHDLALKAAAAG